MNTDTPRFAQFAGGTLLKQENGAYMLVSDHEKQIAELRGKLERLASGWEKMAALMGHKARADVSTMEGIGFAGLSIENEQHAKELRAILNEGSK